MHRNLGYVLLVFIVLIMATASVEASMEMNSDTYCQFQPERLRSRMYSMTGIINPTLPPTTRNASVMTCTTTCKWLLSVLA